jgi:hypothetical protein
MEKAYQDPQTALARVLEEESQWEQAEAELLANKKKVEEQKQALCEAIAADKNAELFKELAAFEQQFTASDGDIVKRYMSIKDKIDDIKQYDSSYPKGLTTGKYEIDEESNHLFWINYLDKIAGDLTLNKFLQMVFSKSAPFEG